jgi:hypothetical protein
MSTVIIGNDLDTLLAPLDDVARLSAPSEPTAPQIELAYALGLLAAELTINPPSMFLLATIRHLGLSQDQALTIGRALAETIRRVSARVGQV